MIKEKSSDLDTINIGIVGHIDHGKTTLLQKLTNVWASRHSEELKRGISIKLGYADITVYNDNGVYNIKGKGSPVRHVSFVDAPGHEMLMATMLSGAALIDAAILVIAANEGIKPQTREHLIALQAKNIKNLIIVQNKIDLVDKEKAKRNYIEIKELLKGKFDNAKIIPASAQQEVNIDKILKEITEIKIPERKKDGIPIFLIARSFDINKPGTTPENLKGAVLGGALKQGTLKENDEIEVKPGRIVKENNVTKYETIKTKVKSLFIGSKKVKEITPGGSMSIETELDMSLGKADILSGNLVSSIGNLPELSTNVKIQHKLFPEVFGAGTHIKVPPIKPGETLMLSINTSITGGSVKRATADQIEIELRVPAVIFKKDNVGIARNIASHWRLIGYGEII